MNSKLLHNPEDERLQKSKLPHCVRYRDPPSENREERRKKEIFSKKILGTSFKQECLNI
jgi:hypothetical protein